MGFQACQRLLELNAQLHIELQQDVELDLDSFQALVESQLPTYAQPVFIRVLRSAETTATFKMLKGDLREQAYHPDKVGGDPVYVRKPRGAGYEPLDNAFYQKLIEGDAGY